MELKTIHIDEIVVGTRFREDYGDLDSLVLSLKKEGIIQPLAVMEEGDSYILLAGGRRYAACDKAGITEIPVRIYPDGLSDMEMRSIELMENVCRKDLTWVEATNLKKEILELQQAIHGVKRSAVDETGVSLRDIAEMLQESAGGLSQDIKLAKAMDAFPTLKEAKTKADAVKMLKRMQEGIVVGEIAKRIQAKQATTPLEVQRSTLISNFVISDFFEYIQKVPDRSIDLVEIDPPYAIGIQDIKTQQNQDSAGITHYNEVSADDYQLFLTKLFRQCNRVMSENSWIICWFAYEPWFEVVYSTLRNAGFQGTRTVAVWTKDTSPGATLRPDSLLGSAHEPFFYLRKGQPTINRQGRGNVFNYKPVTAGSKIHPTERPIELMQDILQTFGWESCRVYVPFLGSGNTLLAASNLGMSAFGTELSVEYKNAYTIRVQAGQPGSYRSYREG